jgi:hypothetical protein
MAAPEEAGESYYQHTRLRDPTTSIRILLLQPTKIADDASSIEVTLEEASLENKKTKYDALSYTWGAATGTIPISCHGKALLVTENCFTALRQLRLTRKARPLWIDAICIDQAETPSSVAERNQQVGIMGRVYRQASRVIVWLGATDSPQLPEVFRRLRYLGRLSSTRPYKSYDIRKWIDAPLNWLTNDGRLGFARGRDADGEKGESSVAPAASNRRIGIVGMTDASHCSTRSTDTALLRHPH